jgi:peptidoglycan/LPS O-acetylase OafA/YrhL
MENEVLGMEKIDMKESTIYLSGLNGLRAIAALAVVFAHISQKGIADFGLPFFIDLPMAGYGVTLFFVISGFLITYLLLKEHTKTDTIDIKKFYARRILRIWPIYYLFIIACFLIFFYLNKTNEIFVSGLWYYVFFAANIPFIFQNGILILVHYWSIGVEEQFYLFWPWIVRFSKNKLLNIAIVIFFMLFVTKLLLWFSLGPGSYSYRFIMVTRFHCMMIGAIGAILFFHRKSRIIYFFSTKYVQLFSWVLFFLMGLGIIHIPAVVGQEIIAFASLSMIIGQVTVKDRLFNLENKLCDFIGKISYGIYVIHPIIVLVLSRVFKNMDVSTGIKYIVVYSSVIGFTLFFAWLSYTYFEMPFLKLKRRFAVVPSSNSMLS